MDIGHKIKQLRVQNGLTLEELASRSELTKGFLSQLERNLTSPSISTLEDILEALGSSLSDFFMEEKNDGKSNMGIYAAAVLGGEYGQAYTIQKYS